MRVSIKDLKDLIKQLKKEAKESVVPIPDSVKWSIPIINNSECSDTWEIEK